MACTIVEDYLSDVDEVREVMMGHKQKGSGGHYFDNHDVEMVRKQYMKADWSRTSLHRIDKIEEENDSLRNRVMELERSIRSNNDNKELWTMIKDLQNALLQYGIVTSKNQSSKK